MPNSRITPFGVQASACVVMHWNIHHLSHTDSTNSRASEFTLQQWQQNQSAHHHVITATTQSAGRGQHGRPWQSPVGGLYLSAILENIPEPLRDKLALIAGVALCKTLTQLQIKNIGLRWPNDITLGSPLKKAGGILCESLAQGEKFAGIIGIGLNVNTSHADLPDPIHPLATTLLEHTHQSHDLPTLTTQILNSLDQVLAEASANFLSIIIQARNFDSLRGHPIELLVDNQSHTGTAAGLSDSGALLLQTPTALLEFQTATLTTLNGTRLR